MYIIDKFILTRSLHSHVIFSMTIIVIVICFLIFDKHISNLLIFSNELTLGTHSNITIIISFLNSFFLFFFIMIERYYRFLTFWDCSADGSSLYNRKLNRKYYYFFFCYSRIYFMRKWIIKMIWLISRLIRNSFDVSRL